MKAHLILTAMGPILTACTGEGVDAPEIRAALRRKGIHKLIAFEVPLQIVIAAYREPFEAICEGIEHDLPNIRVIEIDGPDIFAKIPFSDLGDPVLIEE